jgi:hypothetical protein
MVPNIKLPQDAVDQAADVRFRHNLPGDTNRELILRVRMIAHQPERLLVQPKKSGIVWIQASRRSIGGC